MTQQDVAQDRGPSPAALPAHPKWLDIANQAIGVHGAIQKAAEYAPLLELVAATKPETIVEVGADKGGTLYGWSQLPGPPAVLAVDMPWGPYRAQPPSKLPDLHGADLIIGDSHDPEVLARVETWLDGRRADVMFIDADHTYAGVAADFRNFRPLTRTGGLVVFHDILIHPQFAVGVSQLWEEIKYSWPTTELIAQPLTWGGIGVLTNTGAPKRREPVRVRRGS
jgi:Methyltransferase domain